MDDAQIRIAAAVDRALAPLDRPTQFGPATREQLAAVISGFRQALLAVVAGDPGELPDEEIPRDESVEDEARAHLIPGSSEPQFAPAVVPVATVAAVDLAAASLVAGQPEPTPSPAVAPEASVLDEPLPESTAADVEAPYFDPEAPAPI